MEIQSRLPAALCALHNVIRTHSADDEIEIGMDFEGEGPDVPFIPEVEPELEAGGG